MERQSKALKSEPGAKVYCPALLRVTWTVLGLQGFIV